MLIRSGSIVLETPALKKELTVRAVVNNEFSFPPPPFKVFRKSKKGLCIPRYFGIEKFGIPKEDRRPEPSKMSEDVKFIGKLRDETFQNEALRKGVEAGHGILSLDCGFGKTVTAIAIACKLKYRTMIVVHKEFLANQWEEKINQFCPDATIGRVQQNKLQTDCDFVIAMLQSLSTREYQSNDFDSIGTMMAWARAAWAVHLHHRICTCSVQHHSCSLLQCCTVRCRRCNWSTASSLLERGGHSEHQGAWNAARPMRTWTIWAQMNTAR